MNEFLVLFCLFIFYTVCSGASGEYDNRIQPWLKDINASIKINIRRKCKWKNVPGFGVPIKNSDTFYASTFLPTRSEWNSLQSLPVSLTKASKVLLEAAHIADFYNKSFEKGFQWQMPTDHPAQNKRLCYNLTRWAAQEGVLDLYQGFRSVERSSYLLRNRRGIIHPTGSVAFSCGYFIGQEGCETRWGRRQDEWYDTTAKHLREAHLHWESPWDSDPEKRNLSMFIIGNASKSIEIEHYTRYNTSLEGLYQSTHHKRVYLLENQWDYNYHHFMADCLARLVQNIKFLRANTDVMIHIRASELYDIQNQRKTPSFRSGVRQMRNRLFQLLGISPDRIVYDIVVADEVYMPRVLHCTYAISNPIEIRALARELITASYNALDPHARKKALKSVKDSNRRKNLIIQQRYTIFGSTDRFWNNGTLKTIVDEFTLLFPSHNVIALSSHTANQPDYCLECEIRLYQNADILVGNHGAGLTSAMFMPPGGLVVEIVGSFNNVNMPVCGYYGPWSSMFGHHHYLYTFKWAHKEKVNPVAVASEARKFFEDLHYRLRRDLNISHYYHHNKAVVDLDAGIFK